MKKFVEKHIKKAKNKYYSKYFEQYKTDSRKQWNMLNLLLNRQRKKITVKKLIDGDGNTVSSPQQMAETFNNYFVNIASSIKQKTCNNGAISSNSAPLHANYLTKYSCNTIHLWPVDSIEINSYINDLKNKSTSDTKISALKMLNANQNFTHVLVAVIEASFVQGIFPRQLKHPTP